MRKDLTVKDVLYALEYMHDQMVRTPAGNGKAAWMMKAGGQPVKQRIADEVCASGLVSSFEDHGKAFVTWRRVA